MRLYNCIRSPVTKRATILPQRMDVDGYIEYPVFRKFNRNVAGIYASILKERELMFTPLLKESEPAKPIVENVMRKLVLVALKDRNILRSDEKDVKVIMNSYANLKKMIKAIVSKNYYLENEFWDKEVKYRLEYVFPTLAYGVATKKHENGIVDIVVAGEYIVGFKSDGGRFENYVIPIVTVITTRARSVENVRFYYYQGFVFDSFGVAREKLSKYAFVFEKDIPLLGAYYIGLAHEIARLGIQRLAPVDFMLTLINSVKRLRVNEPVTRAVIGVVGIANKSGFEVVIPRLVIREKGAQLRGMKIKGTPDGISKGTFAKTLSGDHISKIVTGAYPFAEIRYERPTKRGKRVYSQTVITTELGNIVLSDSKDDAKLVADVMKHILETYLKGARERPNGEEIISRFIPSNAESVRELLASIRHSDGVKVVDRRVTLKTMRGPEESTVFIIPPNAIAVKTVVSGVRATDSSPTAKGFIFAFSQSGVIITGAKIVRED